MTDRSQDTDKAKRLTPKQESFCLAYLETGNASEAYRKSYSAEGMKPETINKRASELLADGAIAGRIQELSAKAESDAVMTRQRALERLSLIAETNITDILEFDQHEVDTDEGPVRETIWRMKDSEEVARTAQVAIKSVTMTKYGPKIEMHDKLAAIQQIAKLQGWESATKHELSGPDGAPIPIAPTVIELVAPSVQSKD